jgi:hypothetical protein
MLSRALSLATVTLLIGCFAAIPAQGQNLEAGKSPSQIFAGTCNACHKGPRGLLKTVPAGSLPGFLRQHYTTSGDMASLLAAFLISNGATDNRYVGSQPKPAKDAAPEGRPAGPPDQFDRFGRRLRPAPPPSQEAANPDADGLPPQAEPGHRGRNAKRLARPAESPDAAEPTADGQTPAQAAGERGPDGRKSAAKHKLSKRGKPGAEEPSKTEADKTDAAKADPAKTGAAKADAAAIEAAKGEPAKGEAAKDDTSQTDTAKGEDTKPEGVKPSDDGKSESAKIEAPKESGGGTPATRADPVPPVTPAPSGSPSVSAVVSSGTPEPPAPAAQPASPAVRASVPPPSPPVAPAGPPIPPISQ